MITILIDQILMLIESIGFITGIAIMVGIGYLLGCIVYDKFYNDEEDDDEGYGIIRLS